MKTFLSEINSDLASLTSEDAEACERDLGPIKKGERSVGVVPEEFKNLFILLNKKRLEALGLLCEKKEIPVDLDILQRKAELIAELFWIDVRTMPGLQNPEKIGVRQGWTIVVVEEAGEIPLELFSLLGIGRA